MAAGLRFSLLNISIKLTAICKLLDIFIFSEVTPFLFSLSPQTVKSFLPTACGPAPSQPSVGPRCGGTRRTRASRSACATSTCKRRPSTWRLPRVPSRRTPSTPSTPTSSPPSWRATSASTTSGDPTSKSLTTKPWPAWSTPGRRGLWFSPADPFGSTKPFLSKSTSPTLCAQGRWPTGWRPATPAPCAPATSPITLSPWSTERSSGPSAESWCLSRAETSWDLWWIRMVSCTWVTTVLALACRSAWTVPSPSGCSSFYTARSCKFDCWVCWTPFFWTSCTRKRGGIYHRGRVEGMNGSLPALGLGTDFDFCKREKKNIQRHIHSMWIWVTRLTSSHLSNILHLMVSKLFSDSELSPRDLH